MISPENPSIEELRHDAASVIVLCSAAEFNAQNELVTPIYSADQDPRTPDYKEDEYAILAEYSRTLSDTIMGVLDTPPYGPKLVRALQAEKASRQANIAAALEPWRLGPKFIKLARTQDSVDAVFHEAYLGTLREWNEENTTKPIEEDKLRDLAKHALGTVIETSLAYDQKTATEAFSIANSGRFRRWRHRI